MMASDFDFNPRPKHLPCGSTAYFDESSGIGYRCEHCMAVVGSMGQPRHCKDEAQKYENWKKLGGKGWDYFKGNLKSKPKVLLFKRLTKNARFAIIYT